MSHGASASASMLGPQPFAVARIRTETYMSGKRVYQALTTDGRLEGRGLRADYSGCRSRNSREVFRTFLFAPSVLGYLERPRGHFRGGTIYFPIAGAVGQNFEV